MSVETGTDSDYGLAGHTLRDLLRAAAMPAR